eukprot:GHVU01168975.1.p1 GENE.GHVU01168975.1~~GHVU01168975.1.p1  ORF type:complete len:280 (+),score=43.44 GHVU01168975.1:514-1353(+)
MGQYKKGQNKNGEPSKGVVAKQLRKEKRMSGEVPTVVEKQRYCLRWTSEKYIRCEVVAHGKRRSKYWSYGAGKLTLPEAITLRKHFIADIQWQDRFLNGEKDTVVNPNVVDDEMFSINAIPQGAVSDRGWVINKFKRIVRAADDTEWLVETEWDATLEPLIAMIRYRPNEIKALLKRQRKKKSPEEKKIYAVVFGIVQDELARLQEIEKDAISSAKTDEERLSSSSSTDEPSSGSSTNIHVVNAELYAPVEAEEEEEEDEEALRLAHPTFTTPLQTTEV